MKLHPVPSKRFENWERLGRCVEILLKKYNIKNPAAAVVQYLGDGLLPTYYRVPPQNIYLGHVLYSIEDVFLLKR